MAHKLLPIEEKINHDGMQLKIVKQLKGGLTGEVYEGNLFISESKAPQHVAIKIMKALEFPMARQFFLQESETLAFLVHLEEDANRTQGVDLKIAPKYFGRGEYQGNPYLVMEFIEGKEIPDLLKETDEGCFPEKQALVAAWHLYRTLDVLHKLLRKTYIDLKFENLWWIDTPGQLKLTDFGTLEDIKSEDTSRRGVSRDILLGAVYFCKMATGYTPNYSLGELKDFGELEKNIQAAKISWGTRRELKRLLHRNPGQRPADAGEVAARLRTLVEFWSQEDVDKVSEFARKSLETAQTARDEARELNKPISQDGLNVAYRSRSAFEVIKLRFPDKDIHYDLDFADHLERGKNLLRGRSYSLAKQVFQEGMEWGDNSAALRRWAYLAEIGEAISPIEFEGIQNEAFTLLDEFFGKKLWNETLEQLEKVQSVIYSYSQKNLVGLNSLFAEAHLFSEIENAESSSEARNYDDAAKHYRSANMHLEALPDYYKKFIRDNEVGDLEKSARQMDGKIVEEKKKEEIALNYKTAIQYAEEGEEQKAREITKETYRLSCAFSHETERISDVTRTALKKRNYKLAFDLAQIALVCGKNTQKLRGDLELTERLHRANDALNILDVIRFYENIVGAFEFDSAMDVTRGCIEDLLEKAEQKTEYTQDPDLYLKIAELKERLGEVENAKRFRSKAEELNTKKADERHTEIRRLIADARGLTFIHDPFKDMAQITWLSYSKVDLVRMLQSTEERYRFADRLVSRAESIASVDEDRLEDINGTKVKEEIKSLKEEISAELKKFSDNSEESRRTSKHKYDDNLSVLNQWWGKIEPLYQWHQKSRDVLGSEKFDTPMRQLLYNATCDFLNACYAILQDEKPERLDEKRANVSGDYIQADENPGISERDEIQKLIANAKDALRILGPAAWKKIKDEVDADLTKLSDMKSSLEKAEESFKAGDSKRAQSYLDQARSVAEGTDAWKKLSTDTFLIMIWKKFQEDHAEGFSSSQYHPELLKAIRDYAACKFPAKYWNGSAAESYLKRIKEIAQIQLAAGIDQPTVEGFVELVKKALDVSWTARLLLPQAQRSADWKASDWLTKTYPAIYEKNVTSLTSSIQEAPIPEQIDFALLDINPDIWKGVAHLEENKQKRAKEKSKTQRRLFAVASVTLLAFCGVLALVGFLNRGAIQEMYYGTPTPTATITPSITPTPAMTDTPTLSPTPTFTPTPLIPSAFLLPNPKDVYPAVPDAAESAWLIPPEAAAAVPPISDTVVWTKETSSDAAAKGEVFYSTQKAVNVFWMTDQPLAGGWYSIYILDTKSKSGGYGPQAYIVSSNEVALTPFRGQSSIIYNTEAQGQKADQWLSLGIYEIPAGQKIEVRTNVPDLSGNARFALSKLLIVKLTDTQKSLYDLLPSERVLSLISDDPHAVVLDTAKKSPLLPDYQGHLNADPNSWGGGYRFISVDSLNGISTKVSVKWDIPGSVSAGKYQLMIWVPAANASAEGEFSILLNGTPLDKQVLPSVNQADHAGQWWPVDIWSLPDGGSLSVLFTVDPAKNAGKTIGIDAIALVKVE